MFNKYFIYIEVLERLESLELSLSFRVGLTRFGPDSVPDRSLI